MAFDFGKQRVGGYSSQTVCLALIEISGKQLKCLIVKKCDTLPTIYPYYTKQPE